MKQIFTLSFLVISFLSFSQHRQENSATIKSDDPQGSNQIQAGNLRTSATSAQIQASATAPLYYNLEDKYMGREAEFLGNLKVSSLPSDFPLFKKEMTIKEYNAAVDAYYIGHENILKERVKEKLILSEKK